MEKKHSFNGVAQSLSPSEAAVVLAALRQDSLVWESLEDEKFSQTALQTAVGARSWTPGRMALVTLGSLRPADLRCEPMIAIGQGMQEKALRCYQSVQRNGTAPANLREAGLLALALRERRRLTGSWNGLLQEILSKPSDGGTFYIWRSALACLYDLIPDPENMLLALLKERPLSPKTASRVPLEWLSHIVLCQPLAAAEQALMFMNLLRDQPTACQLAVLRSLSLRGQESLAGIIADGLLVGHAGFASVRAQSSVDSRDLDALSSRALSLQQMGAFYQLAGETQQALSLYEAAESALCQWLAGLYVQRLNLHAGKSTDGAAEEMMEGSTAAHRAFADPMLVDELGAVLLSHPYASAILEQSASTADSGFLQLERAAEMFEREPALARDLARQGAQGLVDTIDQHKLEMDGAYVYAWRPEDALYILLELDLPNDALRLAQAALQARPVDVRLLCLTGRIQEQTGSLEAAVETIRQASVLEPENPTWKRELGRLCELRGAWQQSYTEYSAALALCAVPATADRLACAQAALKAGLVDEAAALSEVVLETDADSGAALGILGQALVARGDMQQAQQALVRATLLMPEALESWLSLAQAQNALGEAQRALETLRSAVAVAPDAPQGHLALGQACVSMGLLGEALPHLKKAYLVSTENELCAQSYARTLRLLGHAGEARSVLERARSRWAQHPELAYEYAQVLLDLDDPEGALPVLETALRNGLPVLDGHLLYARVLLSACERNQGEPYAPELVGRRLEEASAALHHILEVDPGNLEARFLAADLYREKGELEIALAAYRALSELPAASATELRWRVQWGMGRTALRLNQTDTALAAFQEACQAKPGHLLLRRGLAEASLRAGLAKEALDAAQEALRLASGEVDNLIWFAEFAASLKEFDTAIEALDRAAQIEPQRASVQLLLAEYQVSAGEQSAARVSLERAGALESVSAEDLRWAGHIYMRMEDPGSALACFEKAASTAQANGEGPAASLLVEMAELSLQMGRPETALALAQRAAEASPDDLTISLLQADLLGRLHRPQAALAMLEQALATAGETGAPDGVVGEIHRRFVRYWLDEEALPRALEHAEKALALNPGSPTCALQAAKLALALLQPDRAATALAQALPQGQPAAELLQAAGAAGLEVLCLKIEIGLETGQDEAVAGWIAEALGYDAASPRVLAARSRLLACGGDMDGALRCYEAAAASWRKTKTDETPALWLAEAALEAGRWQEALALFDRCARTAQGEAHGWLRLARALTLAAELQRLCAAVDCRKHAPGADVLGEKSQGKLMEAVQAAGRIASMPEVNHWLVRGQAAFQPSNQSARALAALAATTAEDAAALIAVLRQVNNRAAAAQVARRFVDDPTVLLQLALCWMDDGSNEGVLLAGKAAASQPRSSLAQAAYGKLARRSGQLAEALAAYRDALEIWSDEAAWHDAAGDLSLQLDQLENGLQHRLSAVELEPENAAFACKAGKLYMAKGSTQEAVETLERATMLEDENDQAWLALAAAYQMADRLPEALEAAKHAAALKDASAEGLLTAGEIALSMHLADQAFQFANLAVKREPENSAAALFLSSVLVQEGRKAEALKTLDGASPVVKTCYPVAAERARLIYELHGGQAALQALEKLVEEYPEEPGMLAMMAKVQAECGDARLAERYAFKSLHFDPDQPELTLMLGRLQHKDGQLDQAVHLFSEVIRIAPEILEAYLELGMVYQERREYSQALQIYRQAMRINSGDYRAYYQSGVILRDSKDYHGAEEMLRRAAELAPENLSIRRQLVGVIALNLVHAN